MHLIKNYVWQIGVAAAVAAGCGPEQGTETGGTGTETTDDPTVDVPTVGSDPSDPSNPSTPSDPSDPSNPSDPTDPDPTDPTAGETEGTVLIGTSRGIDVLFVIDNSGSMAQEQANLAANIGAFVDVLEALGTDYRIAVTTTDSGNPRCPAPTFTPENGDFVLSSCLDRVQQSEFEFNGEDFSFACTDFCTKMDADVLVEPTTTDVDDVATPRRWIERTAGQSNLMGFADNVEALRCYLPQGVAGCGFESHLESMFQALAASSSPDSKNFGFIRDIAQLAVVIVSDETDCSRSPGADEIFTTNKVFWNSPDDVAPTSAMCWRAGVSCTGGPGVFTECHADNFDVQGQAGALDADAVLQPISKYVEFVQGIEDLKQTLDPNQEVRVALITGVPVGYESFQNEIPYEDSADPQFQDNFGIGPGCILGDPNFAATAVPPVREREFAEAFADQDERNLFSICQEDYSAALAEVAEGIAEQIKPACIPFCVRDVQPETQLVDPNCTLREVNLVTEESNEIPKCGEVDGAWVPPAGVTVCWAGLPDPDGTFTPSQIDNMSPECVDEGFNFQVILVRTEPAPAGTVTEATCELSQNKQQDCPNL
jgi:hypothetical protein